MTMLPKFAATVSSTTVQMVLFCPPARKSSSVSGTSVSRATSFVTSIESTKHSATITAESPRSVVTRRVSFRLTASSAPIRRNPATIVISEKSISSVVVSMPCKCMTDGGVSRKDSSAQMSAALSTVSRRKYCKIRFTMWFCSLWKMQKASGIAPPVH